MVAGSAPSFEDVLEHLEAVGDWSMTRVQPGKIILGELGGIETGIRQLFRQRPLETEQVEVRGRKLTVSTAPVARLGADHVGSPSPRPGDAAMRFRNVDVHPARPLDEWPAEAIETLIDRGIRSDWKRLVAAIRSNPWGPAARTAESVAHWGEHDGVDVLILDAIADARRSRNEQARRLYAERIRSWRRQAGLTQRQLAELVGTSASRLSAYENARVAPTTDVLGRIEQVITTCRARPPATRRR